LFTTSGEFAPGLRITAHLSGSRLYPGDGFFATLVKNRIIVMNKTAFDISTGDR
jgi:hypothetical protein